MKVEVIASKRRPEKLKVSGLVKMATVVGLVGLSSAVFYSANTSAMSFRDSMVVNPVYQQYMSDVAAGHGDNWRLIPNEYIYIGELGGKGSDSGLPTNYKISDEYLTTLKNQGTDGDCWAFATTTAIESNLKKTKGVDVELSPKQLDYLLVENSPYYNFLKNNFNFERSLGDGGSFLLASFPISGQAAPVKESSFFAKLQANDQTLSKYSSWEEFQDINIMNSIFGGSTPYTKSMDIDQVMGGSNDFVVTKYRHYGGDTDIIDTIKENVYKYGAAYVGTIAPGVEGCWDADTKTIIDLGAIVCAGGGHAMAIIGWDDNHTYTKPDGTTGTGAFLLQNSWGKSSLWDDYGIDTDDIMSLVDETQYTEEQLAGLRQQIESLLNNYDAFENVWLGYDFDDSSLTGWVDFASIMETEAYAYDKVYDSFNQAEGFGSDDTSEASVYTFSTDNKAEYIDAVSVVMRSIAYDADVEYVVYIDATGTGNNYERAGSAIIPKGEMGQETINIADPVKVSGVFKIKVEGVVSGEVQEFNNEDLLYRSVAVYATDDIEVPDTDGGDKAKAPESGANTISQDYTTVLAIVLPVMLGMCMTIKYFVRTRKSIKLDC